MIAIEQTALQYFHDNIGSADTFLAACAYIDENAIDMQINRDANGRIVQVTAFRVELTYITTETFKQELDEKQARILQEKQAKLMAAGVELGGGLRRKLLQTCDSANHHLCCSQTSINAGVGGYCQTLGCDFSNCGGRGLANVRPPGTGRPGGIVGGRPERPESRPTRPGEEGGSAGVEGVDGRPNKPSRPTR